MNKKFVYLTITSILWIQWSCTGRSKPTEEPKFYSSDNPGKWEVQEPFHIPKVTYKKGSNNDQVNVVVPLQVSPEHYIEVILLTDGNHRELAKKSLRRSESPEATLDVPSENHSKLYVVIKCNLHDMWEVEVKPN